MKKITNNFADVEQKKISEQEGVKIEPYNVFGRDFSLTDPDFIKYYKVRMKIMAVRYQLLGRVNNKGFYQIPTVVKQELVGMFKEIEDMDDDWYRASAVYMKKYYYFHVKLTMLENDMAKASLYLSEFVDDFLEEEYIVSHIADFIDVYDDDFRIKVRQAFNLVDVAVPMTDMQVPNIAVVIQDAIDIDLILGGLYDIASQIYIVRMLKLLEGAGEKGQAIIKRYKELIIDKDENDLNEKHRNIKFKSLLDRAIDEFGGMEALEVDKAELKDIIVEMNNSIKSITDMQNRPGAIEIMKAPKKGEEKTAGKKESKGGGGSKKGGSNKSGGKPNKKKESKKSKGSKSNNSGERKGLFSYDYENKKDNKTPEKTIENNTKPTAEKTIGKSEKKPDKNNESLKDNEEDIDLMIEDIEMDKTEEEKENNEVNILEDITLEITEEVIVEINENTNINNEDTTKNIDKVDEVKIFEEIKSEEKENVSENIEESEDNNQINFEETEL